MVTIKKKCKTCGKRFETPWPRKMYCSEACKQGVCECEQCGARFVRKKQTAGRFCTQACSHLYLRAHPPHTCPVCGNGYRGVSKTCSHQCGFALRRSKTPRRATCEHCDNPLAPNVKPHIRFCSRRCSMLARGEQISRGRTKPVGTKKLNPQGYVMLKTDEGWRHEHRVIMEAVLGRRLQKKEHVHHKNGKRNDNRPENLELWAGSKDPPGVRLIDKAKHIFLRMSEDDQKAFRSWLKTKV